MITIVEDFVSKEYQEYLKSSIDDHNLPLYWYAHTGDIPEGTRTLVVKDGNTKDDSFFVHQFIRESNVVSSLWGEFSPLVTHAMAKTGLGHKMKLNRVKLNLSTRMTHFTPNEYYMPHIDVKVRQRGITAIYYMNDADGDTLFFETPDELKDKMGFVEIQSELKVIKRITPKQGMLVYFDNQILHTGTPPQETQYRSVINFNWIQDF